MTTELVNVNINVNEINDYINNYINNKIDYKLKSITDNSLIEKIDKLAQEKINILCDDWAKSYLNDRFIGRCWNQIGELHLSKIINCPDMKDKIIAMYKETPEGWDNSLALEALRCALSYNGYEKQFIEIIGEKFLEFFNNNKEDAVKVIVDSLARQLKNVITFKD